MCGFQEPIQIQLERPGSLTLAMCQLLNEIQETKKGTVTPKELFTQVCKKWVPVESWQIMNYNLTKALIWIRKYQCLFMLTVFIYMLELLPNADSLGSLLICWTNWFF